MSLRNPSRQVWETKLLHTDVNPPILNTLHEILNITGGCRLKKIVVYQSNTPVDAEEIDVVITLDGVPYTYDGSAIGGMGAATDYQIVIQALSGLNTTYTLDIIDVVAQTFESPILEPVTGANQGLAAAFIERESIKVEVRQTSPIEAGARIRTLVVFDELKVI